eukprot:1149469-Pelagomonas_calceolata.AAC.1
MPFRNATFKLVEAPWILSEEKRKANSGGGLSTRQAVLVGSFQQDKVMSELLDLLLTGMDQPQADMPNSLAEDLPV